MAEKISSGQKVKDRVQSFDDLFSKNNSTWVGSRPKSDYIVEEIDISLLKEFDDHPFKVLDDDKMQELVDSIKEHGVINPIVVREASDGRYEIIAGHRRKYACEKLNKLVVPVRVIELDDDAATILMVQSNFTQREEILPSEKAKAYRKEFDALKHQGDKGGYTAEMLGEAAGDSKTTVKKYIKLSYLIDPLLDLIDNKKLGSEQGYVLAFLNESEQESLYRIICELKITVTYDQALHLKEYSQKDGLSESMMKVILTYKEKKPRKFAIKADRLNDYFTEDYSSEDIEKIIYGLLDRWKEETNG